MRHGDKINNLGRKAGHRRALMANLTIALITSKRIKTTLAKAKALRVYAEPILTKAKNDTTHSRRVVFSYLQDKEAVKELFGPIAEKIAKRDGGYTRIIKFENRLGDNAETAFIELVDFNETYTTGAEKAEAKKKRSRRGGGSKKTTETPSAKPETTAKATPVEMPQEETTQEEVAHVEHINEEATNENLQASSDAEASNEGTNTPESSEG